MQECGSLEQPSIPHPGKILIEKSMKPGEWPSVEWEMRVDSWGFGREAWARYWIGRVTDGKLRQEISLAWKLICGREATVYTQSWWLRMLRMGWREWSREGFKSGSITCWLWAATSGCLILFRRHTMLYTHWLSFRIITPVFSESQHTSYALCFPGV